MRRDKPGTWDRFAAAALSAGLLLTATLTVLPAGPAGPAAAFHTDAPVAHSEVAPGPAAYGIRVDQDATADIIVEMEGDQPDHVSRVTAGGVLFNAEKEPVVMFAFTFLVSPERLIAPAPLQGPLGEPMHVAGDASALDDVELTVDVGSHCPRWFCAAINLLDRGAGTHWLAFWMGGVGATELLVRGDAVTAVETRPGTALAVGDTELPTTGDGVNVQAQHTVCDTRTEGIPECPAPGPVPSYDVKAGAKVIADVTVPVQAEHGMWAFWQALDFKIICQFTVGECPHQVLSQAEQECNLAVSSMTPEHCERADLDWSGPGGIGNVERWFTHAIVGGPPGAYEFEVERMVDVWGPRVFDPQTFTFFFMGEYFTNLVGADVALPA